MSKSLEVHPAATIFPLMPKGQYEGLRDDIKANGLQEPLTLWKGKLIDGRNRQRACEELGIEPSLSELDDAADPIAYVLSVNLHRRQLTTSQKAMCAAKLAGLKEGRPSKSETVQNCTVSDPMPADDAAKTFGVGRRSVFHGLDVLRGGCEKLIGLCETGEVPVSLASKLIQAETPKKEQVKIVSTEKPAKAIREVLKANDRPKRTRKAKGEDNCKSSDTPEKAPATLNSDIKAICEKYHASGISWHAIHLALRGLDESLPE